MAVRVGFEMLGGMQATSSARAQLVVVKCVGVARVTLLAGATADALATKRGTAATKTTRSSKNETTT